MATGSRDTVLPGVTGLLVPAGDLEILAQAILQLLADPARCKQMGAAARRRVTEHFLQARVHALTVTHFNEMLPRRSGERVPVFVTGAAAPAE